MNAPDSIAPVLCDFCAQPLLTGELISILEDIKEAADNGDTQVCWSLARDGAAMLETTPKGAACQTQKLAAQIRQYCLSDADAFAAARVVERAQ